MIKMVSRMSLLSTYLLTLLCYIPGVYNVSSTESCKYWKQRYPDHTGYMCSHTWYGMYPYKRQIMNGGVSNIGVVRNGVPDASICHNQDGVVRCTTKNRRVEILNTASIKEIPSDGLSNTTQELLIKNTGLERIHPTAFHGLTALKKLTIIESKLKEVPDLSKCANLIELDLYSNNIQIFLHNFTKLPQSLTKIILTKNWIDKIPHEYFNLPQLQYISLSENQMRYVPGQAFCNVPNLVYMGIDSNYIGRIAFPELDCISKNNSKLVHLNASNNIINYISPKILKDLYYLKILELHNNSLEVMPVNVFFEIPEILHLDLVKNKIKILTSRAVENCPKLITIRLHSQQLSYKMHTVYYDSLKNLTSLKQLWLSDNILTRFPHPLLFEDCWISLSHLYIGSNHISSMHDFSINDFPGAAFGYHKTQKRIFKPFMKTPALVTIEMERNLLLKIEAEDLAYCNKLNRLVLNQNQLQDSTIHETAFQNTSLRNLDLRSQNGNGIQYVPLAVMNNQSLSSIQSIDLSYNKITFIQKDSFSHLSTLLTLDLSNNRIVAIEDASFPPQIEFISVRRNHFVFTNGNQFRDLAKLQHLYLDNNHIKVVPNQAFHGLIGLKTLSVSHNYQIGRILKTHLQDVESLEYIDFSHNKIAYIENGTFASIKRSHIINFSYNMLSQIPVSDFWNIAVNYLIFSQNRIVKVPSKAFVNITSCATIDLTNNKIERIEANGFENVDCSVISIGGVSSNPLKHIQPFAFNRVSVHTLSLSHIEVRNLPSHAIKIREIKMKLDLTDGLLTTIDEYAFSIEIYASDIDLRGNMIQIVSKNMFMTSSNVGTLYMDNNEIQALDEDAFVGLLIEKKVFLSNNKLTIFPSRTLMNVTKINELDLSKNFIQSLPSGSLQFFTNVQKISLHDNKIEKLVYGIFRKNVKCETIDIRNNNITVVENGAFLFDSTSSLVTIALSGNTIEHVPTFGYLPNVKAIYLSGVRTLVENSISSLPNLKVLQLNTKRLQCDCYVYSALYNFMYKNPGDYHVFTATCENPASLNGFNINVAALDDMRSRQNEFICTPTDLNATAPSNYTIHINFTIPSVFYPNSSYSNQSFKMYFTAVCETSGDPPIQATVLNMHMVEIFDVANVHPGQEYKCYMFTTLSTLSGSWMNLTSAQTEYVYITTKETKEVTKCANGDAYQCLLLTLHNPCVMSCDVTASEVLHAGSCTAGCCTSCYKSCTKCNTTVTGKIELDITYYDFGATDEDFNNLKYVPNLYVEPKYVASPYETWLAISEMPTGDSFSHWFRSASTRNKAIVSTIILTTESIKDPLNNEDIYKFWNNEFWPVDGKGFGAQGQTDCSGGSLRNQGFTSSIRTAFTYAGNEHFEFAGGEELWVYINKVLVLEILHDPTNTTIPCGSIVLQLVQGQGYITPKKGVLNNGSCHITSGVYNDKVHLNLMTGVTVGLDIFHVERFLCSSEFYIKASGVSFAGTADQKAPRVDYLLTVSESATVHSILTDITIADVFSVGPFTVVMEDGNDEDRFQLRANDSSTYFDTQNITSTPAPTTTLLHGKTIILCSNQSGVVKPIPKTVSSPQTFADIATTSALLTLKNNLDFEATPKYLLRMTVIDKGLLETGNITVQVLISDENDNCPILPAISYNLEPIPPLQTTAMFNVTAQDLDSNNNGKITYVVSDIKQKWYETMYTAFERINSSTTWVNKTIKVSSLVHVFAVDNGSPQRGDYITFNVTYSATCQEFAQVIVDSISGEVYFTVPKMVVSIHDNTTCIGCKASYYCPGDGRMLRCGFDPETRYMYSYGASAKCSICMEGYLCHNGTIEKCPTNTFVTCNETYCPPSCTPCPAGTYCYEGKKYDCKPGYYSDGTGKCEICRPGSYSNESRASSCTCCPPGYYSTSMKTKCEPCPNNEYSDGNCGICKTCETGSCACESNPCFPGVACQNIELGKSKCGNCPIGYTGNGINCTDVNECSESPCFYLSQCVNQKPGFRCTGCPPGYAGSAPVGVGLEQARNITQHCVDINECNGDHGCDANSQCVNTMGSYYCGNCDAGYVGNGSITCHFGDFCAAGWHKCSNNATCVPLSPGKFYCECLDGFAGDGFTCGPDHDYDGISTEGVACSDAACKIDNCPTVPNTGQEDADHDKFGDVCDMDDDNDQYPDVQDNCQFNASYNQSDSDDDGVGDVCDNCVDTANIDQNDVDADGIGDACDSDIDGDGIDNAADNCPYAANVDQTDGDGDKVGDACDNCPAFNDGNQLDVNKNGYGDNCENGDKDGDSIIDRYDNCVDISNPVQSDVDHDGKGDICDDDSDGDGVPDEKDNCIYVSNSQQEHVSLEYDLQSNAVGDACLHDFDGDTFSNQYDTCPYDKNIHITSFEKYTLVDLAAQSSIEPNSSWRISNKGRDVEQLQQTLKPSLFIGDQRYGEMDFSGVIFVNEEKSLGDYIGFVFGYQSNRKFYLVQWRRENLNYRNTTYKVGIKGIQIKLVNSSKGPRQSLEHALWHSADSSMETTLLWHDLEMKPWQHKTPYIFILEFKPSLGRMRLKIQQGSRVITDSGLIYNTAITGGKVGLFTFGQGNVIWSKLEVKCKKRVNHALQLNGVSTYVTLPSIQLLKLVSSFTLAVWLKLPVNYLKTFLPIICDATRTLCLYIDNRLLHGSIGGTVINGNTVLASVTWHHVNLLFDAQVHQMQLFVNGSLEATKTNVKPHTWPSAEPLYIGRDAAKYFVGVLDEISIWRVPLSEVEILSYMKTTGLVWPKHQKLLSAHYNMDEVSEATQLHDDSGHVNTGQIHSGKWVESYLDKSRFQLTYPSKQRRKRATEHTEL